MFCTKCGKKISNDAEFCTECGKKVSSGGSVTQEKIKPRYVWLFRIIKWIGYPVLFFLMFIAVAGDIYYFGTSQTFIAVSILAGILLVMLMIILQKYIKLFRYAVTGLLMLSVLAGLALLGVGGYQYLIKRPWPFSSSLLVTVFKGPVSGATVNIYVLKDNGDKGVLIKGPLTSDASGSVLFDLPSDLPKRLFIESKGGSYRSEATGQQVGMKDTDILTAVLPADNWSMAITPFTHMAAALAKARIQAGTSPADAVISANEDVAKQYGIRSVLSVPVDAILKDSDSARSEEKQYGLLLAGFAQLAKNLGVRSIDLADALAKDWSDGTLDGKQNNKTVVIAGGLALGKAGTEGLNNAKEQFVKSGKAFSSKEASMIVSPTANPSVQTISEFTITTKSLPAWVSGHQGSYTVKSVGGSLPVRWSVKSGGIPEGFQLSPDGIISGSFSLPSGPSGLSKKVFPEFTLEAKDQNGRVKTITLSITVVTEAPQITTNNPPTLAVDESYEIIIATANGGMPPYKFYTEAVSGPMPMGMQIVTSGNTAILSGSPQAKGSFYFSVCVADKADTEKCDDVSFTVKNKEVVAPTPASTPTPKSGIEGWDGDYYGTSTNTSGPSKYCSSGPVPYKAEVKNNRVTYTRDVLSTPSDQGYIDSSGSVKELSWSEYEGIYQDYDTLQFYKSDGKAYLKGTGVGITDRSPDYVAECTWSITAERDRN